MTAINEEGIDNLMTIEGDRALNMVVEAIEREQQASEAVSKKEEKEKKDEKKKKKKKRQGDTDSDADKPQE